MKRNVIVIGASAGGVEAVPRLLGSLPQGMKASFFVTLHVPPHARSILPQLISSRGFLPAEHASDGSPIRSGRVYVAPPDYHLLLEPKTIRLSRGPKENRHRPAIDPLFRSAAKIFGGRVAGVLLTGNLDDGVAGLRHIQQEQGLTIVQDPLEAAWPDMPRNALKAIRPDYCLKLEQIEQLLRGLPEEGGPGTSMKTQRGTGSRHQTKGNGQEPRGGEPVPLACPECHGPMWEFRDGELVRFQCLVGHRYNLESLLSAHAEELEAALWIALRAIEERINLQRRLMEQSRETGRGRGFKMFQEHVAENTQHARLLRTILTKMVA